MALAWLGHHFSPISRRWSPGQLTKPLDEFLWLIIALVQAVDVQRSLSVFAGGCFLKLTKSHYYCEDNVRDSLPQAGCRRALTPRPVRKDRCRVPHHG